MKFSRIAALLCAVGLSGCAYLIPPDDNAPRNNIVVGEPHRPQLNNVTGPQSSLSAPSHDAVAMNLPPVDAATQAQAQSEMAASSAMPAPAGLPSGRHVPAENAQMQVSSNDYPPLTSVPPRPVINGPDSAKARLGDVKTDLEQNRDQAISSKNALAKDAAAEPSMLPKTDAVVPPADAVTISPLPPETPAAVPAPHVDATPVVAQPVAMSQPKTMIPGSTTSVAALPATATFAPPAPLNAAYTQPVAKITPSAPTIYTAPVQQASIAPVTQPTVVTRDLPPATAVAATPAMTTASAKAPVMKQGDFDPLAAADNAPISNSSATLTTATGTQSVYGGTTYLAPSRYADRRY